MGKTLCILYRILLSYNTIQLMVLNKDYNPIGWVSVIWAPPGWRSRVQLSSSVCTWPVSPFNPLLKMHCLMYLITLFLPSSWKPPPLLGLAGSFLEAGSHIIAYHLSFMSGPFLATFSSQPDKRIVVGIFIFLLPIPIDSSLQEEYWIVIFKPTR